MIDHVSAEDIKERIFNGEKARFVETQDDVKRMIKSEWIIDVLKENGTDMVKEIYVKNAIIKGDLDFRLWENLVNIEESGLEAGYDKEVNGAKVCGYSEC